MHTVQSIDASGTKRFLSGGRTKGCDFVMGRQPSPGQAICIAEGFATAASINEATGLPTVTCFNSGNLIPVAQKFRDKYPGNRLIICADDDHLTDGNPGLTKATEAANKVGASLVLPVFGTDRQPKQTDFNDMHQARGLEAVRQTIIGSGSVERESSPQGPSVSQDVENSAVTEVTAVQPNVNAGLPVTAVAPGEVTAVTPSFPPHPSACPVNVVLDDWLTVEGRRFRPGVYQVTATGDELSYTWICSPLRVEAITRDNDGANFGRILRFKNTDGKWGSWPMPMEMLSGSGEGLRAVLLSLGVEIATDMKARNLLASYLQNEHPKRKVMCVTSVGWCDRSFVLPTQVIGERASEVVYQSGERGHAEYKQGGTFKEWQAGIAAMAVGNPTLMLAISSAFSGPMLALCNAESGGVHFYGDSSTGKTTLIDAASSVWGGTSFKRTWRTTANGIEGAACMYNHSLLALDEISECKAADIGQLIYAIGNGVGKMRAWVTGSARPVSRWLCSVLSSGERTIETSMKEAGFSAKAGQGVRLLDISVARKYGAWDDLHGIASGTSFFDSLKRVAARHHGHAGLMFLQRLTRDDTDFCGALEQIKSSKHFHVESISGQEKRAAARFALIALAGELATEYGITGWSPGEALSAAAICFNVWLSSRERGNSELRKILAQLRDFIERHEDSRFSSSEGNSHHLVRDRAGWWKDSVSGDRVILFNSAGMNEALAGFDFKRTLQVLAEIGVINTEGGGGRNSRMHRIDGTARRLYEISMDKLGACLES